MRFLLIALALSAVACDSSVEADDIGCGPTYPCGLGPADATLADVHVNEAGDTLAADTGSDGGGDATDADAGEDAGDADGD